MNISARLLFSICICVLICSCSLLGLEKTPSYLFTAQVSPSGGGAISPDSSEFEEGSTVTAEAMASAGYLFDNWTGDITSEENPLSFEITENTEVTANFLQANSNYEVEMTVEDSADSMTLMFGQNPNSSAGFDEGSDLESPPKPPEGSLHSYFQGQNRELLHDFRSDTALSANWDLNYQIGSGDTLQLSWNITSSSMAGTLILRNEDSSVEVDMSTQSSVDISASGSGNLTIEYEIDI